MSTRACEGDLGKSLRRYTLNSLLPLNLSTSDPFTWDICPTVQMSSSYSLKTVHASFSEMPLQTLPPRCHCPYFPYRACIFLFPVLSQISNSLLCLTTLGFPLSLLLKYMLNESKSKFILFTPASLSPRTETKKEKPSRCEQKYLMCAYLKSSVMYKDPNGLLRSPFVDSINISVLYSDPGVTSYLFTHFTFPSTTCAHCNTFHPLHQEHLIPLTPQPFFCCCCCFFSLTFQPPKRQIWLQSYLRFFPEKVEPLLIMILSNPKPKDVS